MDLQNLAYALDQVVHNFGAAAVVGSPAASLWVASGDPGAQRRLAWLTVSAWALQAASGAAFGAISFHYYGQFPDIHGVAIAALGIKVACAVAGFFLATAYLVFAARWSEKGRLLAWGVLLGLGATALAAAAFLRWFS